MSAKKTRKYVVTLVNGRQITLVNISSYQRLVQGEIQFFGPDGEKSDYLNAVQSVVEQY